MEILKMGICDKKQGITAVNFYMGNIIIQQGGGADNTELKKVL